MEYVSDQLKNSVDRPLQDLDFRERLILREIMRMTKGVDERSKVKDALRRFEVLKSHNFDQSVKEVDLEVQKI